MRSPRWRVPGVGNRAPSPHGLVAWLEATRVVLPLKGVECRFEVCGAVAEVWIDQIYHQDNREALDCVYQFPLPADASVFACDININGRVIRAKVEERGEARRLAAQKKAAGHRTGLVEMERDNLFTLNLGNVQPDDLVIVRLGYFQSLRHLGPKRTVEIPFSPGIRYIPGQPLLRSNVGTGTSDDTNQVPDASRISPPRMDRLHPDAAYLSLRGRLDRDSVQPESVGSPTHPIGVRENGRTLDICLADGVALPDCDFVLRWDETRIEAIQSRTWTFDQEGYTYALLEIKAPATNTVERKPMDFYFLVDRSGSMYGVKWSKAVEALQTAVNGLGQEDRVMITLFESSFKDFAEKPLPKDQVLNDPAFNGIERLGTAGGTELVPALSHVVDLWRQHSGGRGASLILITDAQVGNEQAVLREGAQARSLPIHCFGIDNTLNDGLLIKLAAQQSGTFHSLKPGDDIVGAVSGLVSTVAEPLVRDLAVANGWEAAADRLPDLYPSQTLYVPLRYKGKGEALSLTGRDSDAQTRTFECTGAIPGGRAVACLWAKRQIERWLDQRRSEEAIELSKAANLICELTAFVAWDEQQKVAVAQETLVQPVFDAEESVSLSAKACAFVSMSQRLRATHSRRDAGWRGQRFLSKGSLPDLSMDAPPAWPNWELISERLSALLMSLSEFISASKHELWLKRLEAIGSRDTLAGQKVIVAVDQLATATRAHYEVIMEPWKNVQALIRRHGKSLNDLGNDLSTLKLRPLSIQEIGFKLTELRARLEQINRVRDGFASLIEQLAATQSKLEHLARHLEHKLDELLFQEDRDRGSA